jgi:4-alpha-glucanotransferase
LQVVVKKALKAAGKSSSVFSIHSLQDWLGLGGVMGRPAPDQRINEPGTVSDKNWRLRMPIVLEELKKQSFNKTILALNRDARRS